MKPEDLKVGMKVVDRWYPDWGKGRVASITKTTVKVLFPFNDAEDGTIYDFAHIRQFVEPA